jgi:hypothetical protein
VDDLQLPPRDQTVVSEMMLRRKVQTTPYIKKNPDKGGQTADPVQHNNDDTTA